MRKGNRDGTDYCIGKDCWVCASRRSNERWISSSRQSRRIGCRCPTPWLTS